MGAVLSIKAVRPIDIPVVRFCDTHAPELFNLVIVARREDPGFVPSPVALRALPAQAPTKIAKARSHEELIAWQPEGELEARDPCVNSNNVTRRMQSV